MMRNNFDDPNFYKLHANQVISVCESTNELAKKLAQKKAPHGTWVSSLCQTKGKGRLGREWDSQIGNLFFSIIIRDLDKERWSWAPLITALALIEGIREQNFSTDLKIKWPNDLMFDGKKLGGILCEGNLIQTKPEESYLIIGVGLNCKKGLSPNHSISIEEVCLNSSSSKKNFYIDLNEIRIYFIEKILSKFKFLQKSSLFEIIEEYEQNALFKKGMQVEWGVEIREHGEVIGVGSQGELNVTMIQENGEKVLKKLYAEEISMSKLKIL